MKFHFDISWQLEDDAKQQIDADLFAILIGIQQTGSLKQAAEHIGISYRHAWGIVNKWEQIFSQPLIVKQRGRGAYLTLAGEALVNAQNQLNAKFSPGLNNFALQISQQLDDLLHAKPEKPLRVFASHGLAVNALFELASTESNTDFELHYHGSLESLKALQRQDCDIAGFHLPTGKLGKKLLPDYLTLLAPEKYTIISVVKRNQGLIMHPSVADDIKDLSSISNSDIRFINRQLGSGTRLLFDLLIEQQDIEAAQIKGYNHEEYTHLAVAAMIKSGAADVGFGIQAVAEKFELNYQPVVWENYCLAVPNHLLTEARVESIEAQLQSSAYEDKLNQYSGYDLTTSGQRLSIKQITN
jgi:molybdate transport repressor ModE-like protein